MMQSSAKHIIDFINISYFLFPILDYSQRAVDTILITICKLCLVIIFI